MALFDNIDTQATSLMTAALEDKGAAIQAEMLKLFADTGADGGILAGMLFLIAIASGVFTVAIGGRFLWTRYLLIAPPLFFFLTQVTVSYAGTKWQHADEPFPSESKQHALRGVINGTNDGAQAGTDVAMFFQFWNVFMSDLNKTVLKMLNLTEGGGHLNFISKIERYMTFWNINFIKDKNYAAFIRIALAPQCSAYLYQSRIQAEARFSDAQKAEARKRFERLRDVKVFSMEKVPNEDFNQLYAFLEKQGVPADEAFTCQELWDHAVRMLKPYIEDQIKLQLKRNLQPGQTEDEVLQTFLRKINTETSRIGATVKLSEEEVLSEALRKAVDWVIARSLFHEIWNRDKYADYWGFRHSGVRATGIGGGGNPYEADQIATTSAAIQQFNETERYQFKGDYVNAALSLPHFQGVILMLLSASYPFFALAVLLPGRASAIFTWMGLWAWVKMWDIGLGVVMMVDNILYALFPRGPNLGPGEIDDAGLAWSRIMEIDPNYHSAVYYNIIATCLYAVPLVTGVFVRGGGRELINASHSRWQKYADRLAGSAGTFARSLQAQSYAGRMERTKTELGIQAAHDAYGSERAEQLREEAAQLAAFKGFLAEHSAAKAFQMTAEKFGGRNKLSASVIAAAGLAGVIGKGTARSVADARMGMLKNEHSALIESSAATAMYNYTNSSEGYRASESAVAARYFSHDMSDSYPGKEQMNLHMSQQSFDANKMVSGAINEATAAVRGALRSFLPGGAKK